MTRAMMLGTAEIDKYITEQVLGKTYQPWLSPSYSTDDTAARGLIDQLQAMGHTCYYRFDGLRDDDRYTAMINNGPRVDSDTLALSIAMAVKKHFEQRVENE